MAKWLVSLLLVLCGCAPAPYLRVTAVDADLTLPLSWAASRWYVATGVDVRRVRGGDVTVYRGVCAPGKLACYEHTENLTTGERTHREIRVEPRVRGGDVESVLVHELGHAMGPLTHHSNPGIMQPVLVSDCLTRWDLNHVCGNGAPCRWERPEC